MRHSELAGRLAAPSPRQDASPEGEFKDRTVWVTGGASGQGARHVERFLAAGARVGCIDRDEGGLRRLVAATRSDGGKLAVATADVSDWSAVLAASEHFSEALGDVEIVVANAGIVGQVAPVGALDPGAWAEVLGVNLTGAFHTVKAAVPQLERRGGGVVVLVASAASFFAYPGYAAYSASKHGMLGLMRALANELGPSCVRVNAVCPGWVDTPMLDGEARAAGLSRERAVAGWVQEHVIERLVTPDEVSDAVMWVASDSASMVTGVALPIDGGQLVRRGVPPATVPR